MSYTNVTFPPGEDDLLRAALDHYRFESASQFFRACGRVLIEHHSRGDGLCVPLSFESMAGGKKIGRPGSEARAAVVCKSPVHEPMP